MKNLKFWLDDKELKGTKDVLESASLFIESMSVFVADNSAPIKSADGRVIYTPDRLQAYCVMGSPWYLDQDTKQPAKHKKLLVKTAVALDTFINLAVLNNSGVNEILIRHKDDILNVIDVVGKADTKNHLITDGKGWRNAIDKIFNGDDTDRAILYLLATDDSNEKIKIPCTNMDKMLGAGFEKDYEALREKLNASVEKEAPAEEKPTGQTAPAPTVSVDEETAKELPDPIKETVNDLEALEKDAQKVVDGIMAEGIAAAKEIINDMPKLKLPPTPGEMAGGGISSSTDTGMSTLGKVAVGVGVAAGAAVIGYGLYRAYNALFVDTEVTSGNFNGGDNNILGL